MAVSGMSGGGLAVAASQYEPVIAPGTMIGSVDVGGLSIENAQRRLRVWWDAERLKTVQLETKVTGFPKEAKWAELGLRIDDVASVSQITPEGFWGHVGRQVGIQAVQQVYSPVFLLDDSRFDRFEQIIARAASNKKPARATWDGKAVSRSYEVAAMTLNRDQFQTDVLNGFATSATALSVPLIEAPKRVPDTELDRIQGVVSTFATRFPASNVPRSANIRLASSALDGLVLMPGEKFSFNEVVGRRTTERGYRVAGVFVNGRLDEGVGGGICQVSTTLYNAVALADLKIVRRQNHSLAVPYVLIGRDAAVSYGALDLAFENNQPFPIAIDPVVERGKITFRVLGVPDATKSVTIERGKLQSWSRGTKFQHDGSLAYGRTRLIDKGGSAHRVTTYRVVRVNGKVVRREVLAVSQYPGSPRLVAKNLKARPPVFGPQLPPGVTLTPVETASPNFDQ